MSANLKSVNLKFNEGLLIQLQEMAQRQYISLSEIVSVLLTQFTTEF
jgi:hypothetical protein